MQKFLRIVPLVIMLIPIIDFLLSRNLDSAIFTMSERVLFFVAALCLLVRHKVAWLLSVIFMVLLIGLLANNLLVADYSELDLGAVTKFMWTVFGLSLLGILGYSFRYPYLDMRQKWFAPTANRYLVATPVLVNGKLAGKTTDLSYNGAKIILTTESELKQGDKVSVQLSEVCDLECQGVVIGREGVSLRVNFSPITGRNRDLLRQWLISQNFEKT